MDKRFNKGFTLIELLVVIAIIGLLSTLAVYAFSRAREKAKISKAQFELNQLRTAILQLGMDTGQWPNHQSIDHTAGGASNNEVCETCTVKIADGASGLTANDTVTPYQNWSGPYMPDIPLDSWKHQYFFDTDYQINPADDTPCNGGSGCIDAVAIGSYGPNGLQNNGYDQDDVIVILYK